MIEVDADEMNWRKKRAYSLAEMMTETNVGFSNWINLTREFHRDRQGRQPPALNLDKPCNIYHFCDTQRSVGLPSSIRIIKTWHNSDGTAVDKACNHFIRVAYAIFYAVNVSAGLQRIPKSNDKQATATTASTRLVHKGGDMPGVTLKKIHPFINDAVAIRLRCRIPIRGARLVGL